MSKKKVFIETICEKLKMKCENAGEFHSVDDDAGILQEGKLDIEKAERHRETEKRRTKKTAKTNAERRNNNVESLKHYIISEFGGVNTINDKKIRKCIHTNVQKKLAVTRRSINTYLGIIKKEAGL